MAGRWHAFLGVSTYIENYYVARPVALILSEVHAWEPYSHQGATIWPCCCFGNVLRHSSRSEPHTYLFGFALALGGFGLPGYGRRAGFWLPVLVRPGCRRWPSQARALPLRGVLAGLLGRQFPQGGPVGFLGSGNEGLGPLPGVAEVRQIKEAVAVGPGQTKRVGPAIRMIHRNRPFPLFHLGQVGLWRAYLSRKVAQTLVFCAQNRV